MSNVTTKHQDTRSRESLLSTYGADLLFAVQVIGGLMLILPMMVRNWTDIGGVSLSFMLILFAFCFLQESLAVAALRAEPSRKARQAVFVYGMWIVLTAVHIALILYRGMYRWDTNDTVTIAVTAANVLFVYVWRRWRGSDISDPITKSQFAMATRGAPQLLLGVKVAMDGGSGLPGVSVLMGNLNIWIRMFHLVFTHGEAKWDKNRYWLLASEVVNAACWGVVSAIWLLWYFEWIAN